MKKINFEVYPSATLEQMKIEIERVLSDRQSKQASIDAVLKMMADAGLTTDDIASSSVKPSKKAAVKYRHPENHAFTWSGRGKRPTWLNECLEKGGSLESLSV